MMLLSTDFSPVGPRYSNMVLQTLLILLSQDPPKGRRLLVLCTTSCKTFLNEVGMLSVFTAVLRVPAISRPEQFMSVLEHCDGFSKDDLHRISKGIAGKRIYVGIKKLLAYTHHVKQIDPKQRADKFIFRLQNEECIGD